MLEDTLRALEAKRTQPVDRRRGRKANGIAGQRRDRAEQRTVEDLLVKPAYLTRVCCTILQERGRAA